MLSSIVGFDKSKLTKTKTQVRTQTGAVLSEERQDDGTFVCKLETKAQNGFMVIDTAPDEHLHRVAEGLYLGSQDAAANLEELRRLHVSHIINCASGIANLYPKEFTYLDVEMLDVPEFKIADSVIKSNEFIEKTLSAKGVVLVHCNAGVSRSVTLVLAYLMKTEQWNTDQAYKHVKQCRPAAQPNAGFLQQLREWTITK